MTSYPFIHDLFTNVLQKSRAIAGRFYVCPKGGSEINSDMLGEVLTGITQPANKYPLVLMLPPRANGSANAGYMGYFITLFFLKTTYYGAGANINSYTQTAMHTIEQDWHDMARCATAFINVLNNVQRRKPELLGLFRMATTEFSMQPVSEIGVDRASGVRVDFQVQLANEDCVIEDYNENEIDMITVPDADSHPEHEM